MEKIVKFAREEYGGTEKVECMTLEVDDDNEPAIGLYRKVGFGEPKSIGRVGAKGEFGKFVLGRSIMRREI